MSKSFLLLLCLLSDMFSQAQTNAPAPYQSFIPKGFSLLDSASGHLNKDGINDMVLILKNDLETANPDTTRPLLLLAGIGNGLYKLLERNDHVVLCAACGGIFGDPYEGVVIKNGFFSIEHYGGSNWRWTRIITFKYDPVSQKFKLHKDAGVSYHVSDPDKQEEIVNNKAAFGKRLFSEYTYED